MTRNSIFNNLGLKIVLWLPYTLSLFIFAIGNALIAMAYDIPLPQMCFIMIFILFYAELRCIVEKLRLKYWPLTKL